MTGKPLISVTVKEAKSQQHRGNKQCTHLEKKTCTWTLKNYTESKCNGKIKAWMSQYKQCGNT